MSKTVHQLTNNLTTCLLTNTSCDKIHEKFKGWTHEIRTPHLLWMELVESPIHPHSNIQMVQSSVLTNLVRHGSHSGSAELSGAVGNRSTHFLHDDTVITGAVQAQLLQDAPHLQKGQPVTEWGFLMGTLVTTARQATDHFSQQVMKDRVCLKSDRTVY